MPQAWEAGLSLSERRAFSIIYGDARVQEGIYKKMVILVLSSKAPGTISGYVTMLLDKKASLADVQIFGGWKSESTPLHYHNQSTKRRMDISEMLKAVLSV